MALTAPLAVSMATSAAWGLSPTPLSNPISSSSRAIPSITAVRASAWRIGSMVE